MNVRKDRGLFFLFHRGARLSGAFTTRRKADAEASRRVKVRR